jgi:hypothetical protein
VLKEFGEEVRSMDNAQEVGKGDGRVQCKEAVPSLGGGVSTQLTCTSPIPSQPLVAGKGSLGSL